MKLGLPTVVMALVGGILVYSAVKDKNPLDVIKMGLQGKAAPSATTPPTKMPTTGHDVPIVVSPPGQTYHPGKVVSV